MSRFHTARETHGIRWWLGRTKGEFYWWPLHVVHFGFERDDEGLHAHVRLAMFSLFLALQCRRWPFVGVGREFKFYIENWTIRLTPWGRSWEWRKVDPWWVRGVTVDLADVVLGRMRYSKDILAADVPCVIPMPEGNYLGTAEVAIAMRKRPRWFARRTQEVWLNIPKGIPHAGKGENSWDCGDDGLFGIGGSSVPDAIERARASVLRDRKRYGNASDRAIKEALA